MTHPWMPSSPCGDGCVHPGSERAGSVRIAARYAILTAMMVTSPLPLAGGLLPGHWRRPLQRAYFRAALRGLGMQMRVCDDSGGMPAPAERGVLIVAGHVSWTDVLVLSALGPADFVARADLLDWPLLGTLVRRMRVVPIDRARLRELPGAVDEAAERMRGGARVVVFPEGTTWCGRAYGSLRPAMFQSAIDAGSLVAPVGVRYSRPDGALDTTVCFVGDQTMVGSLHRIVRQRRVCVDVRLAPLQEPGTDRRELAVRCEGLVREVPGTDTAADEILERSLAPTFGS